MMKAMTKLAMAICAVLAMPAMASAACEDDPRMHSFATFLADAKQGPVEPMALTPETFLNLTPAVREVLGDNIVVLDQQCGHVQVFSGQVPARLSVPFPVLYSAFYDAVLRGDTVTQRVVLEGFKAEPMEPLKVMNLVQRASSDAEVMAKLSSALGIGLHTGRGVNGSGTCGKGTAKAPPAISLLDIYVRFGGMASTNDAWVAISNDSNSQMTDVETGSILEGISPKSCEVLDPIAVLSSLRTAGIIAIQGSSYDAHKFREERQKWLESGKAERPASLLD